MSTIDSWNRRVKASAALILKHAKSLCDEQNESEYFLQSSIKEATILCNAEIKQHSPKKRKARKQ